MCHSVVPEKLSKSFSIGVQFLYSMLVPTVQRSESATCIHISPPLELLSHPGSITPAWSSQSTDLSSLCYTAASHSLFHTWWWASLGLRWYKIHCNAGDLGSVPGLGISPGGEHGNPLQYSCLENSRDRGALRATVHGVAKSRTRL